MNIMSLAVTELDHLQGYFVSGNRLSNMRQHPGRRDAPIVVRRSRRGLWELIDGHHRLEVARENGEAVILATKDEDTQV